MKLNTVNVTEVIDSNVEQVLSFSDDKKGNKEAKEIFVKLAKENGMEEDDAQESIETGYWNDGGENAYTVFITHSS